MSVSSYKSYISSALVDYNMKQIKIKRRWISITIALLFVSILLFAFGWANSEVSYKYEVQDTVYSGKPLNQHQKDIIYYITSSQVELIISAALLIFLLFVIVAEPTFKGKVLYYDKK